MRRSARLRPLLIVAALATLAACGGDGAEGGDSLAADTGLAAAPPADAPAPAAAADAPLTPDDVDRWQRGMEGELRAVREAGARLARATSAADSAAAIFATNETSTRAAGAAAAGVDEQRYNRIRSSLSALIRNMTPLSTEMDVSSMPAEVQKMMQDSRDQGLARDTVGVPSALLEAIRPRAEALRRQELELVGERLKAAGMAR